MGKTGRYIALIAIIFSSFVTVLNTSMLRVATPLLLEEFQISYSQLTWITNSYQLVYAFLLPILGQMGDRFGRKKLLIYGLAIFSAGSLMSGFSWNYVTLILARVVQAVGAGAILPNSMISATNLFSPKHRGKIIGSCGMAISLGAVCGPSLGGFVTQALGWKYLFHCCVPITLFALVSIYMLLKTDIPSNGGPNRFDYLGSILLAIMIISFVLTLQNSSKVGWTPGVIAMGVIFLTCVPLFYKTECNAIQPILDPGLLKKPIFTSCTFCGGTHLVATQGVNFLIPLCLAQVFNLDSIEIGIMMVPPALIRLVMVPLGGMISDKLGNRLPVTIGLVMRTLALGALAMLNSDASMLWITTLLVMDGAAAAIIWAPVQNAVIASSDPTKASSILGVFNMVRYLMGVTGTVIIGIIMDAVFTGAFYPSSPVPGFIQSYLLLAIVTATGIISIKYMRSGKQKPAGTEVVSG